jgi:hypothetical protein
VTCGLAKQGKGEGAAVFKIVLQGFPASDLNFQRLSLSLVNRNIFLNNEIELKYPFAKK